MSIDLLQFIKDHLEIIIFGVLFIFNLIVSIVRKKPVKVVDTVMGSIRSLIPQFINIAEDKLGPGTGPAKLAFVLGLIEEWCNGEGYEFTDEYARLSKLFVKQVMRTPKEHNK